MDFEGKKVFKSYYTHLFNNIHLKIELWILKEKKFLNLIIHIYLTTFLEKKINLNVLFLIHYLII